MANTRNNELGLAVVLVSNAPGELTTWVRPLAKRLHSLQQFRPQAVSSLASLRLALVPCPNATGHEHAVAQSWQLFDRIVPACSFWSLLLRPSLFGPWPHQGIVVFLGGDQFWTVLLSARLGYRHITYAEWIARWPQWNDRIAAMSETVRSRLPIRYRARCRVVGDLMADLSSFARCDAPLEEGQWVALLPGSKPAKLSVGMPFFLETADHIARERPECRFLLPLAPTTSVKELLWFASRANPIARRYRSTVVDINNDVLITKAGTHIELFRQHPAHGPLSQCTLALTTVGANTAEIGALAVPMIVIVPTQHLDVMQAWDGGLGLLARLPGLRRLISILLIFRRVSNGGYFAWPNITAGRKVVPERIGEIMPRQIATEAIEWLASPDRLEGQRQDLRSLRGKPGAIAALAAEVCDLIP
ncbi:glycosyl transferase [Synechococcus sp. M16CYN]|uniref:glycosyl transferase n=1 Tax=Synechococcus sp. M16CYN TaxID=3103139 RepID=UPI0033407778